MDYFYFFSFCDCHSYTSKTMLLTSGQGERPCLVPDFKRIAFNFLPLRIIFTVGLSYMVFIMLRYVPFYACFMESFCHEWVLNFVKSFFCTYWDDHMVFTFQFVYMVYHIDWFAFIEESLHPWGKALLIMLLWFVLLDSVC